MLILKTSSVVVYAQTSEDLKKEEKEKRELLRETFRGNFYLRVHEKFRIFVTFVVKKKKKN
jgi:hypothetical protein